MGQDAQKKTVIIALSCILLVAVVAAIVIFTNDTGDKKKKANLAASQKAITAICQTTDYQKTCIDSLQGHSSTDPKELIQAAMHANIRYIKAAIHNFSALERTHTGPRTKSALDTCNELAHRAIRDLRRSYSKFEDFDITNVDGILLELKTWIGGAMTHQETCLDAFEELEGDADDDGMRRILTKSMEMTSNALAMVAEISKFLETMGVRGYKKSSHGRRLLFNNKDLLPISSWVDEEKRRLLQVQAMKVRPNIIVAKDGSGKFKTIKQALKHIPKYSKKTFVLYIKEGVYEERVVIETPYRNVMLIGDGPTKTIITGHLNFVDGVGTYQSATVAVHGDDFIARDIGFENTAGAEKLQAVALRASADKMIFLNCHIKGYQDSLYSHAYRQFYRDCLISGTVDFILGDSAAIFQGCTLLFRKPLKNQPNIATAQGRMDLRQPTAFVLQNCTFKAAPELQQVDSYLGRPWKEYSRTVILESFLDDFIHPQGWKACDDKSTLETVFYAEFNNRGPASPKAQRVKWPGIKEVPPNRIKRFTTAEFVDGNRWIPRKTVHYAAGFLFPVPKEDPNVKYSPVSTEETKDLGSSLESQDNETETKSIPPTPASTNRGAPSPAPVGGLDMDMDADSPSPAPIGGLDMDMDPGDLVIDLSTISRPPLVSPGLAALTPKPAAFPPNGRSTSMAPLKAPMVSPTRTFAPTPTRATTPRAL